MRTTSHLETPARTANAFVLTPGAAPESVQSDQVTPAAAQATRQHRDRCRRWLSAAAIVGDFAMIVAGFVLAYWLRYKSDWGFVPEPKATLMHYSPLIGFGVMAVFAGVLSKGRYDYKSLLSPGIAVARFIPLLSVGLFVVIGFTLTFRTVPPISRLFVVCAWAVLFLTLGVWRFLLSRILRRPALAGLLRKRVAVVGMGPETLRIRNELLATPAKLMVGWVAVNKPCCHPELQDCRLGGLQDLEAILRQHLIDVVVLVESNSIQSEGVSFVERICEREHVQFKMVPHFFEILISGLRPSVLGGVPVLGVEALPLNFQQNRLIKRAMDLAGAMVGLLVSVPLILLFGALVYAESPGPVLYRQRRTGRRGRPFHLLKIRSMRVDAEEDGGARWTEEDDPRRLRIGAFMRKWNIDEVPQFWNVLRGDMSLVGPRPERPELIERFKFTIPHYQSRHSCRPGMSGWAQVNGFRGNTSLEERIRYDIWYVENWSVVLDCRIMFLTFFNRQNAY